MALHYHTEYRLGNRGRICRSYTGFQALVAIALDLIFGLLFEFVFLALGLAMRIAVLTARLVGRFLRINWEILVAAMTLLVYIATLPFVWIHQAVGRGRDERTDRWVRPDAVVKPSWALSREV
jgi:hypothetical protein